MRISRVALALRRITCNAKRIKVVACLMTIHALRVKLTQTCCRLGFNGVGIRSWCRACWILHGERSS